MSESIIGSTLSSTLPPSDYAIRVYDPLTVQADLEYYQPNLVMCLGDKVHHATRTLEGVKVNKKGKFSYPFPVSQWRGSLFMGVVAPFVGRKCLASISPNSLVAEYHNLPLFKFDLRRAASECNMPELMLPERRLETNLPLSDILMRLSVIKEQKRGFAMDIEGGIHTMSCMSIAPASDNAFLIPFSRWDGTSYWSEGDEMLLWEALHSVLGDESIPKTLQNSLYDNFVLTYAYRCPIRGVVDDTMLKHWELYPELEKGLGVLTSIYTREPFYKMDRKSGNQKVFWEYCCKDSVVTHEISSKLDGYLTPVAQRHYQFNVRMLNPFLYMEVKGIRYNKEKAEARVDELKGKLNEVQTFMNNMAGEPINVRSPKFTDFLYEKLKLPIQYNRVTKNPTANYEALLKLYKQTQHPLIGLAIRARSLLTRISMLSISADGDGRIRCGYNVVGTETGRITCYTSPTGSGYNLQTIPEYDRDLFEADPGYDMFQCDLSGADGWTVAARCAQFGDPTMMEDLLAGIKIAKVIAGMFLFGPEISRLNRADLAKTISGIGKSDPIYFGSKCCQHGSNYGMKPPLLSATIFLQSEGEVNIPSGDAKKLQECYFLRYPGVLKWHEWVKQEIKTTGRLISASGHVRPFFGRRDDSSTIKQALSNEPQENTTYATNLAAHRLWFDPANRRPSGALSVEPLHQVHDALVGQFRTDERDFALNKIREWFNNPLVIAGRTLVIPFEGGYGPSWGQCKHAI